MRTSEVCCYSGLIVKRKRTSGSMHLELSDPKAKPSSGMQIKTGGRICKLLVIDANPERCTRIAQALPPEHRVLVAQEPTMALALCLRENPVLVVATTDLGSITLGHFIALLDYTTEGNAPPIVVIGDFTKTDPRVVAVLPDADPAAIRRTINQLLAPSDDEDEDTTLSAT